MIQGAAVVTQRGRNIWDVAPRSQNGAQGEASRGGRRKDAEGANGARRLKEPDGVGRGHVLRRETDGRLARL